VNTTAARYQNLSINQTKLSGQCGRLKCCLNYELDTYLDALQSFPDRADTIRVAKGTATLIKKDIFKNLMWYVLPESNKQYPLTIERVRKILSQNAQGIIPDELEAVDVTSTKPKEVEPEFVDVVGQISLRSLEKNDRRRKQQQQQQQQQRQKGAAPRPSGPQQPGTGNKAPAAQQARPQQNRPAQGGQQQGPRPPRPQQQERGPRPPKPQGGNTRTQGGGNQGGAAPNQGGSPSQGTGGRQGGGTPKGPKPGPNPGA
jgi:hypothetical protein